MCMISTLQDLYVHDLYFAGSLCARSFEQDLLSIAVALRA